MLRSCGRYAACICVIVATGCGSDDPETPIACLLPTADYLRSLEAAPEPVRLEGATPISDCVVPGQDPGSLAEVGRSVVDAATALNREARRRPRGDATLQLGYLVGAVQQGASRTGGIHADLVRRLDRAARFSDQGQGFSARFERAFGEGYAAGQGNG
jgi:hypothetical protein